jgi:hypothetical protein
MRKKKTMNDNIITKFLKTYNKSIHESAVSPSKMLDNKDLEVQCIMDSIPKQSKIVNKTPDYKLNANDKVILIELNKTLKKRIYNATSYYYTITNISEKSI